MIWVTAYPGGLQLKPTGRSAIRTLSEFCDRFLPANVGMHLLPFAPSDGDDGFAQRDWYAVDPKYGNWDDLRTLASKRRLIVDGVYNHVGINHSIAQKFWSSPARWLNLVYAFKDDPPPFHLFSPRGEPVIRRHLINGERWYVWQTFSRCQVDIRLDDADIRHEISRHLTLLRNMGVWGVRLDAAAYYAKPQRPDEPQLHNAEAPRLARLVSDFIYRHGLGVIAQLDCDRFGAPYFPPSRYDVPIVDYSYAAHLAHAIVCRDFEQLVAHVEVTDALDMKLIRAPRTHDGILLRSGLLSDLTKSQLVDRAAELGIASRIIRGNAYELNCSLPYFFSKEVEYAQGWHRIELAVAVSAFIGGWCFLYLPMLLGYAPEADGDPADDADADPRSLNRQAIPYDVWTEFGGSTKARSIRRLLTHLMDISGDENSRRKVIVDAPASFDGGVLLANNVMSRVLLIANADPTRSRNIHSLNRGKLVAGWRAATDELGPLGFGFWHY